MEKIYLVAECSTCGGYCCKSLRSGGCHLAQWRSLKPSEVMCVNPWIPKVINLDKHEWAHCEWLGDQGLCTNYNSRAESCRSFPNIEFFLMEYLTGGAFFYVPFCTYREVVLQMLGIPYEILATGEECRRKYLEMIRDNPSLADLYVGGDILIRQAQEL